MTLILTRPLIGRKWQPEYHTLSHQINHLAMALLGEVCRFFLTLNFWIGFLQRIAAKGGEDKTKAESSKLLSA